MSAPPFAHTGSSRTSHKHMHVYEYGSGQFDSKLCVEVNQRQCRYPNKAVPMLLHDDAFASAGATAHARIPAHVSTAVMIHKDIFPSSAP